jgi:DNA-binding PucR family transcriptional regulator
MTTVTKAEHEARLAMLRETLRRMDVADADVTSARLVVAAQSLGDIRVDSDRDADLVWRGVEAGYALALCDIDDLAKSWSTSRRKSTENLKGNQRPALTDERADAAMLKHPNNISAAARSLGVHRKTLERFLARRSQ